MRVNESYVGREAVPNVSSADWKGATTKLRSCSKDDMRTSVTLTRFKIKVVVTELLNFQNYTFLHLSPRHFRLELKIDGRSMGPCVQLVAVRFSNFLLWKLSHEFKLRGMSIFHEIQIAIFRYCVKLESHGWAWWCSCTHCACRYDLVPIQRQGQGHVASKFPKIAENWT